MTTIVSVLACLDACLTLTKDLQVSTLSEVSQRATRSLSKNHNWLIGSRLPTPDESKFIWSRLLYLHSLQKLAGSVLLSPSFDFVDLLTLQLQYQST